MDAEEAVERGEQGVLARGTLAEAMKKIPRGTTEKWFEDWERQKVIDHTARRLLSF